MIVVGSCYFLSTLLTPYDQNIDFCFPLNSTVAINNFRQWFYEDSCCDILHISAAGTLGQGHGARRIRAQDYCIMTVL